MRVHASAASPLPSGLVRRGPLLAAAAVASASLLAGASCGKPRGAGTTAAPATAGAQTVAIPPAPPAPRGKAITILYSSNLLGEYEPCG
jgi:hypothetical protein